MCSEKQFDEIADSNEYAEICNRLQRFDFGGLRIKTNN